MKKKSKNWIIVGVILLTIAVIVATYLILSAKGQIGTGSTCSGNETISAYCSGNSSYMKICSNNRWKEVLLQNCGTNSICVYGSCTTVNCASPVSFCANDYEKVTPTCSSDGSISYQRTFCGENIGGAETKGFCKNGYCFPQSGACGNGICDANEDKVSCYKDCSLINNAEEYRRQVNLNMFELSPYLVCDSDFNCGNQQVINTADNIIKTYNIPDGNPQLYMEAVVKYVNKLITYDFNGGAKQCGQSASTMLTEQWGNCVDYSVTTIALLRAKGIPARQVAGCVSHGGWFCNTFALQDASKLGSLPINWASPEQQELADSQFVGGQVLGHSWVEVWLGPEKGWVVADPTLGTSISKRCVGYYPVTRSGYSNTHKDCDSLLDPSTCYTSAYCHVQGIDVLAYCKTY